MDSSPFNRSGMTPRSPPSTPTPRPPQQPKQYQEEAVEPISTPEIQNWLGTIEQYLNEVCVIASEGKLNSDQKQRITNLCRKVGHGVSQLAVQYQSMKSRALQTHTALKTMTEARDLADCLTEMNRTIQESCAKQQPAASTSFADMVKKGSSSFIRPNNLSSVAIFPCDITKTSDETKNMVQKIICPGEMKLKVRGVRKIGKGGLIISTETKDDLDKLKKTVQIASSGLTVDEPRKRKPRIIVIGVPASMAENEVYKCIYDQNITDKLPMTLDTFLTSIKLSHKSGRKDAESCNYILEVSAVIRKALITQDRLFINWTSCPVRDFTLVTRCYKCQQYGHASKTCKNAVPACGHCGEEGHSIQDCAKKAEDPKCATCMRFKKQANHKTGDTVCPAKLAAEYRYINSIDYEGA